MFRVNNPKVNVRSDALGTAPALLTLPVPLGVEVDVLMNVRVMHPNYSPAVYFSHPNDPSSSSITEAPLASAGIGANNLSLVHQVTVRTNRNGQVRVVGKNDGTLLTAVVLGWSCDHPQDYLTWDSRLVATGGRIDSMCDLGCGVLVCGGRGTNKGKLYRSVDYGETWCMQQHLLTSTGISTIKSRGGVAYALAEDSRIWRSKDAGETWVALPQISFNASYETLTRSYGLEVLPCGTVLVADTYTNGHIFRSVDEGATFVDMGAVGDSPLYRMQVVGDGVLVNGWGGKVWKSADGLSWAPIQVSNCALYAIEYVGDGVVFLGSERGQVFKSLDNGVTWRSVGLLSGEADDIAVLDNTVILSTYTASRELFRMTAKGPISIGQLPVAGWLDHFITVETPEGPLLVGGTSDGYVLRARKNENFIEGEC